VLDIRKRWPTERGDNGDDRVATTIQEHMFVLGCITMTRFADRQSYSSP